MTNAETYSHESYLEHKGRYKGIWAWLLSTDHKRIGLMYMYAIFETRSKKTLENQNTSTQSLM